MGMITVAAPGTEHNCNVPRCKVTAEEILTTGRVEIHLCGPSQVNVEDPTSNLDIL